MNKVYLVYCEQGSWDDYVKWVESVCSNPFSAEKEKIRIETEIKKLRDLYFEKTKGRNYSFDSENWTKIPTNKMKDIFLKFESKYPKIKISNVFIEERELI